MLRISKPAKAVGSKIARRFKRLRIPETKGKYAKEFYYAKRFDWNLFIVLPIIIVFDFYNAYHHAWQHKWFFLINAVMAPVWMIWWMFLFNRRYKKK